MSDQMNRVLADPDDLSVADPAVFADWSPEEIADWRECISRTHGFFAAKSATRQREHARVWIEGRRSLGRRLAARDIS